MGSGIIVPEKPELIINTRCGVTAPEVLGVQCFGHFSVAEDALQLSEVVANE